MYMCIHVNKCTAVAPRLDQQVTATNRDLILSHSLLWTHDTQDSNAHTPCNPKMNIYICIDTIYLYLYIRIHIYSIYSCTKSQPALQQNLVWLDPVNLQYTPTNPNIFYRCVYNFYGHFDMLGACDDSAAQLDYAVRLFRPRIVEVIQFQLCFVFVCQYFSCCACACACAFVHACACVCAYVCVRVCV